VGAAFTRGLGEVMPLSGNFFEAPAAMGLSGRELCFYATDVVYDICRSPKRLQKVQIVTDSDIPFGCC
jgi:hypothetical protein